MSDISSAERYIARLQCMAEELNDVTRRRELVAQDLCDYIVEQWRALGCHNTPVEISGDYSIESVIRARELFLKLPANINMGDPKADFYSMMGRKDGNPYITLCVPGTVI